MSFRYMRLLVFFDLPSTTSSDRREYRKFRKYLISNGYIMLQESVYCKLALNSTAADSLSSNLKKQKPPEGVVQMLVVTEKQYSKMEFIIGSNTSQVIDSTERLIVL